MLGARFLTDRRGVAAIEFAIIAPVGLLLVIGVVDLTRGIIVQQEVYRAAHTIPVLASNLALQQDRTTSLTVAQVQQSLSAVYVEIPWLKGGSLPGWVGAIMSSVDFTQVDQSCDPSKSSPCAAYPHVAWSVAYKPPTGRAATSNMFETNTRPCIQLNQTSPSQNVDGDLTSIKTSGINYPVPALSPMLVVDVHYRYTPMFFNVITGPIDLWSSGYWPTRIYNPNAAANRQYTTYDIANQTAGAGKCSGYP